MTPSPHSIGRDQPLEAAHKLMRTHDLRHLPVLEGGKLVGVVSERDLFFLENLGDTDLDLERVREAMSANVYAVPPETRVELVAREMAEKRYGCAVVVEGSKVVGIFTTTDALNMLAERLAQE